MRPTRRSAVQPEHESRPKISAGPRLKNKPTPSLDGPAVATWISAGGMARQTTSESPDRYCAYLQLPTGVPRWPSLVGDVADALSDSLFHASVVNTEALSCLRIAEPNTRGANAPR